MPNSVWSGPGPGSSSAQGVAQQQQQQLDCCDCCACSATAAPQHLTTSGHNSNGLRAQHHYKVKSVELRGENQETLEVVCLANDESTSNDDMEELSTSSAGGGRLHHGGISPAPGGQSNHSHHNDDEGVAPPPSPCRHCPPPCNDPQCMACLQQCAHKQYTIIKYHQGQLIRVLPGK